MINDDGLRAYADLLQRNGFTIYEPSGWWKFFIYSRVVDGQECFGMVQTNGYRSEQFKAYEHSMPIKPSVENGSSMWVEGVPNELTVEAAKLIARPTNYNPLVGRQKNYEDDLTTRGYVKWEAK